MIRRACLFFVLLYAVPVQAAPFTEVHVAVGKVSEVVLPEKVAKVLKGGQVDSMLVEVVDNMLYLLPKSSTPADIVVTGVSGASYPIKPIAGPRPDVRVEVAGTPLTSGEKSGRPVPLALMKDMLRGVVPAGATVLKSGKSVTVADGRVAMSVDTIYDFPHVAAYVFTATNKSPERVIIPLEQLSFPRLLAAHAAADMLEPSGQAGDSTVVYLVAGK